MKTNKPPVIFNKKKRHFLLIEILIAFVLITLFTFPLIRNPIYFCKSQLQTLQKIECERLADLTFLDIKLAFIKKQINLKNIAKYQKEAQIFTLRSDHLEEFKNKEVKRSYKLYSKRVKQTQADETYKLVYVKVFLQPDGLKKPYCYKYKIVIKC